MKIHSTGGKYRVDTYFNATIFQKLLPLEAACAEADIGDRKDAKFLVHGEELYCKLVGATCDGENAQASISQEWRKFDPRGRKWVKCEAPAHN